MTYLEGVFHGLSIAYERQRLAEEALNRFLVDHDKLIVKYTQNKLVGLTDTVVVPIKDEVILKNWLG